MMSSLKYPVPGIMSACLGLLVMGWSASTSATALPPTEFLDRVNFGDVESESQHQVRAESSPLIEGGLGQPARVVQLEGGLTVTLGCDPELPNMVTIRLWGGDMKQVVTSVDGQVLPMEAAQVGITVGDQMIKEPSAEKLSDTPYYPGRFLYRTIAIPLEQTQGKTRFTFTIKPAGKVGGGYVSVGGPPPAVTAAGSYSRGVYAAYSHTANVFVPPADEAQGDPPSNGHETFYLSDKQSAQADFKQMRENLVRALDEAVEELARRQLFGPEFEAARDELGIPTKLEGLFDWTGLDTYITRGRNNKWPANDPEWLTPVTGSASGRPHTSAGQLYLAMYREKGSRYYGNPEMVDRTIALLDAYCIYQGANGGWEIGGGSWGWVGGPERKRANGGLPGYMAGGLAHSYLALIPELKKKPAYLDERIDNNGDGKKNITRKDAYTQVFRDWLWKDYPRLSLRTACANQDIHTALAAYHVNQCLKVLSPGDAFDDSFFRSAFRQCLGIMPRDAEFEKFVLSITENVSRGRGDELLISPGGVTMEWGFAPGYGQMQRAIAEMCQATGDPDLVKQFDRFTDAIQHFMLPWTGPTGTRLVLDSAIGSRNTAADFRDVDWAGFIYAANHLDDPVAQRIVRFGLESTDNFARLSHGPQDRMHLTSVARNTLGNLENIDEFQKFWNQTPTDYRLPAERPGPYAWTDPSSSARVIDPVMIKQGHSDVLLIQGKLYHFITDRYTSFGQTQVSVNDHFVQGRFGPFHVAINRGQTGGDQVNHRGGPRVFAPPADIDSARDLLTGKPVDLSQPMMLANANAYVLDTRESPAVQPAAAPEAKFVSAEVDQDTQQMVWTMSVQAPTRGIKPDTAVILALPKSAELRQVMQSFIAGGDVFRAAAVEGSSLKLLTVNVPENIIAVSGLQADAGQTVVVQVIGDLPTFANYNAWQLSTQGSEAAARRATMAELINLDTLEWRIMDQPEDRIRPDSVVQRTHDAMLYTVELKKPVSRIAFDYSSKGAIRIPIELVDGSGNKLWQDNANETPLHRVLLEDIQAQGKLTFRVKVESDHIYKDYFHRIVNVRLE